MKRILFASSAIFLGILSSNGFASARADTCFHPYDKTLPYDLPLSGNQATVLLHAEVHFSYDCKSAGADAIATADANLFNLNINVMHSRAYAVTNMNSAVTKGSLGQASVMVLGMEVVNEALDLESLIDEDPSMPIDVSSMMYFNVGPVPVPVQYGVEGAAGVHIRGGIESVGLGLNVDPHVNTFAYVQAGVSNAVVKAYIRGNLVVLEDHLANLLHYGVYDAETTPELRFSLMSTNRYNALNGGVNLVAAAMGQTYQKVLFDWPGSTNEENLFDYSEPVAILQ
ncbi:MAG: hypothetical protein H7249_07015 [Chitinophagaceae bacterium]|nr:hypothetical protein [Oligoflexus sp.]